MNIADTASQETIQHVLTLLGSLHHISQEQSSCPSNTIFIPCHNRFACDVASNLIVEILWLLDKLRTFSIDYRYLQELLLKPLHQTLFLTGIAIQTYENTPLGPKLAASINPEVEQCRIILQFMLDSIHRYRHILSSTPIRDLWPQVLWSGYEVHVLTWKLTARRRTLGQFLVALNS